MVYNINAHAGVPPSPQCEHFFRGGSKLVLSEVYRCGEEEDHSICSVGDLRIWDVDVESWINNACAIAERNLTQAEWIEAFPGEEYQVTCPQWPEGK